MTATVVAASSQEGSRSATRSIRYAGVPWRCASSTRRTEFEEFAEPTTSGKSASGSRARAAFCRLVVT